MVGIGDDCAGGGCTEITVVDGDCAAGDVEIDMVAAGG